MAQKCFAEEYIRVKWLIDLILNSFFGVQSNVQCMHFQEDISEGVSFDSWNKMFESGDRDRTDGKCALRSRSNHSPAVSASLRVNPKVNGLIPEPQVPWQRGGFSKK